MVEAYVFNSKFDHILGRSWLNAMIPTPIWQTDEWQLRDKVGGIHILRPLNGKQSSLLLWGLTFGSLSSFLTSAFTSSATFVDRSSNKRF
jgi:hypothetical protein